MIMSEDAIVVINHNGCMVLINRCAEELFGYGCDDLLGRPIEVLLPDCFWDLAADGLTNGGSGHNFAAAGAIYNLIARRHNGSKFIAEINFTPLQGEEGILNMVVIRNPREGTRAGEDCARPHSEPVARTEATDQVNDELLAMVAHELRTPLNAMLGWTRLLRAGKLDAIASARALETIEHNAKLQTQLIEDLMDASRIAIAGLRLEIRPISLAQVIEAAVNTISPAAEVKGVRLKITLDSSSSLILGDPDRLEQVIWNLLSNAVKFTPRGGCVEVRFERSERGVQIVVSDTGQGISAASLPQIFERFHQADYSSARAQKGLGLGLTIVRYLVGLHGGTVIAESPGEGKGATFIVTLPQLQPEGEMIRSESDIL